MQRWFCAPAKTAGTVSAWIAVLAVYQFSGFPLPGPVLEGIRFQANASSAGEFPAFLNGQWSQTGWWYYFLEAFAVKTPLPTTALVLVGGVVIARRRARADLWFVLPPLLLLYVLSFHYGKNYGVRYLLPALPFLFVIAAVGATSCAPATRVFSGPCCSAALVLDAPHHLAYFNELADPIDHHRRLLTTQEGFIGAGLRPLGCGSTPGYSRVSPTSAMSPRRSTASTDAAAVDAHSDAAVIARTTAGYAYAIYAGAIGVRRGNGRGSTACADRGSGAHALRL